MKKIVLLLFIGLLWACKSDDTEYIDINVAIAHVMSKTEFRAAVEIQTSKPISKAGKIYAYNNYIFINDRFEGVHVIDNTNPTSPQNVAFIKIPGNEDISIKNNFLYADSAIDLVVFDISNINAISMVAQLEDVFSVYDYQLPNDIQDIDYGNYNPQTDVIVGWTVEVQQRDANFNPGFETIGLASNDSSGHETIGTGGSLARFQIVDNYLYTVGSHEMTIFNITNLSVPTLVNTQYSGNNIETMFQTEGYLYLGSTDGMYIYGLDDPENPDFISEFTHWTGCDPVVVAGNYAYLTLRGGNNCGQQESVLEVIDISDKYNPVLVATHSLENPYGLGIKQNSLFICDGEAGLKVFDKTNPLNIQWVQTFSNITATDVIPLSGSLLMIGNNTLYQYSYGSNSIELLSTYHL